MKRMKIIFLNVYLLAILPLAAQAPDWGMADTLAHHKLGPGIQYSNIYFKGKKMMIWVTEVDLSNPYNKIEQVQSNHKVPDLTRWTVTEHYKNNSRPGHKVCVAFNHDFFTYEGGVCIGLNISEGEIPFGAGWGRSLLAIGANKKASVFQPNLDAQIVLPDNSTVKIDKYNRTAEVVDGECILFNRFNTEELTHAGKYIKVAPSGEWSVNGNDIPCEVLAISDAPLQNSKTEYIIFLRGSKLNSFANVQVGEKIFISQKLNKSSFGEPLTEILNAFHGYPSIAFEGKLHEGEYNNFENGREYEISSRVMAGVSQDGNTLYIVTTEMSSTSVGVNCIDLANYMLSIGAWNVVNFDSGGSVAIVIDEEMLNVPARGSVRPVMDALLAVSLAPESVNVSSYSFLVPSIKLSAASSAQLSLLSFNEFDEVLEKDVQGFKFTSIPEELGFVDENQIFRAGVQAINGKIIAEKDGIQTEIKVSVQPIEDITINPDKILIDATRQYPIAIETNVNNTIFPINPSMLLWEIEDQNVCTIENGVLKGVSNGESKVIGTFGELTKPMHVKVEIGEGIQTAESFEDISSVETKSSGIKNLIFTKKDLPDEWQHGFTAEFDFVAGRAPYLDIMKETTFYGLPDSLSWKLNNQGGLIKNIQFFLEDIQGKKTPYRVNLETEGLQDLIIPFSTNEEAWDVSRFPISLKQIKIYFNSKEVKKYDLQFSDLQAHYPKDKDSSVGSQLIDQHNLNVFNIGNDIHVEFFVDKPSYVSAQLFSVDGSKIQTIISNNFSTGKHQLQSSVAGIPKGVYIVKLTINGMPMVKKILIK